MIWFVTKKTKRRKQAPLGFQIHRETEVASRDLVFFLTQVVICGGSGSDGRRRARKQTVKKRDATVRAKVRKKGPPAPRNNDTQVRIEGGPMDVDN